MAKKKDKIKVDYDSLLKKQAEKTKAINDKEIIIKKR